MTQEVITLQLGNAANFIGAHYWNVQETLGATWSEDTAPSVNSDVIYRVGETTSGVGTYTPRLVLFDVGPSYGTLKVDGYLYDASVQSENNDALHLWGDVTSVERDAPKRNLFLRHLDGEDVELEDIQCRLEDEGEDYYRSIEEDLGYVEEGEEKDTVPRLRDDDEEDEAVMDLEEPRANYQLDRDVRYWSDYLMANYHPKSAVVVPNTFTEGRQMEHWSEGVEVYKHEAIRDGMERQLHFFAEECDHLQGFNVVVDYDDGYGGLASSILQEIREDYGKKSILVSAISPQGSAGKVASENAQAAYTSAISIGAIMEHVDTFVPLAIPSKRGLPFLEVDPERPYHTSAVLGCALDSMTLPFRLPRSHASHTSMLELSNMLSLGTGNMKLSGLSYSLPLPLWYETSRSLRHRFGPDRSSSFLQSDGLASLSPCEHPKETFNTLSQSVVVRTHTRPDGQEPLDLNSLMTEYMRSSMPRTFTQLVTMTDSVLLPPSFPHFFSTRLHQDGTVSKPQDGRRKNPTVRQTPTLSHLHTSRGLAPFVKKHMQMLEGPMGRYNGQRWANLSADEIRETAEVLGGLYEEYVPEYHSSEEEDIED